MEGELSSRFAALQETMLEFFEDGSQKLEAHIRYWGLVRREQAMLHKARTMGMQTLAGQVVPALQVSLQKGRQAVSLHLALQSLAESAFSLEPWTMSATSLEMWTAAPQNCFKRGGRTFRVQYDGDPKNTALYTMWGYVYYANQMGGWSKVPSALDARGAYYLWEGNDKVYYVDLLEEAPKCSKQNTWVVTGDGETYTYSPSVTSCPISPAGPDYNTASSPTPSATVGTAPHASPRRRARDRCDGQPPPKRPRPGFNQQPPPGHRGPLSSSGNTGDSGHRGAGEGPHSSVPVVLLTGGANQLKCLRHRLRHNHQHRFEKVSTTWTWACGEGEHKHHLLVTFTSDRQRQDFCASVPIPKGVLVGRGPFPT